jgi:tripartite-type tricarboxylate transporter receptor subunit TctC
MKSKYPTISRRSVIKGSAAALGMGAFTPAIIGRARAQSYPSRNVNFVCPTNVGGGVENHVRNFSQVWGKYLGVDFEFEFHPGAAGQVGYELFVHRKERDGYNLLFGNIGPEVIMYVTQNPSYQIPEDLTYIASTSGVPMLIFVGNDSPIQTIEELVEEGKRRTVNISTSRLPHPATIGALALGEETGADFNLIAFAGGNPTSIAAISGEVDAAATTANQAVALSDQVRVLCTFKNDPRLNEQLGNPPTANEVFGLSLPELEHNTGMAIHTEVWENNDEVREVLSTSIPKVFEDPELEEVYARSPVTFDSVAYQNSEQAMAIVEQTIELANRYKSLITA